eukprot:COSAG01_NODE_690_length_14219_cov_19.783144_8_plen_104_part_00
MWGGLVAARAETKLAELEAVEGVRFTGADEEAVLASKNQFKEMLMRKMLDGQLQAPWTPEDEREFRALFTRALGGESVRSEEALSRRGKESSLLGRLGAYRAH